MIAGLIRMTIARPALDPAAADERGITAITTNTAPFITSKKGLGPLVDLRPAVLCHHSELHGPAGDCHSEAGARKRDALVRIGLWVDRVLVPVRLCRDDARR